jgi:hypothetical protein
MKHRFTLAGVLLAAALQTNLFAQTGEIRGSVTDQQGGLLPGVAVTIGNTATGVSRSLTTDDFGAFRAAALQPGPYKVSLEFKGFRSEARTLELTIGETAEVKVSMNAADVTETVEVKEAVGIIDTAKSDISGVVSKEQLADLPVINRGFIGLGQLIPGGGPSLPGDARFGMQTTFGGSNVRSGYSVLVDGAAMDHPIYGLAVVNVNQDAVQEFRVMHNQYDAEYSRAGTAVVTVLTKSGTNDWNGMFSYFGRYDALNARNTFANSKPPFNSKRFSGTFGGPIIHNKTHFFGAVEIVDLNSPTIIALPAVNPFASTYNGDYPAYTKEKTVQAKLDHTFNQNNSGFLRYLFDDQHIGSTYQLDQQYNIIFHDVLSQWNWTSSSGKLNSLELEYLDQNTLRFQQTTAAEVVRPSFTSGASPNLPQGFPRSRGALNETFYFTKGRNTFKAGTRAAYENLHFEADYYGAGVWNFNTDLPFNANVPSTYPTLLTIGSGPSVKDFKNSELGFFFQDDIKLAPRFTLNAGLRYDLETNLRDNAYIASLVANPQFAGLSNLIKSPRGNDLHDLQPRLGFAWDVLGDGRTVIRGGFGAYSARNRPWFDIEGQVVSSQFTVQVTNPAQLALYPDVNAVLGGISLGQYAATKGGRTLYLPGDHLSIPYVLNGTIGIQKALWKKDTVLQVDLIRQIQTGLQTGNDANLPAIGPLSTHPRPYPQFGAVTLINSTTESWYSALQVQFHTRFKRVYTQAAYTWSKVISAGNDDNANIISDPYHILGNNDRGLDEENLSQALSWTSILDLPYGFQLSTIVSLRTGPPWNITAGKDLTGDGDSATQRPSGLVKDAGGQNSTANLAIINAYRTSLNLAPVTMAKLTQGDGAESLDLRLTRGFRLGERMRLDLFMEAYNAFNHANYLAPNGVLSSPAFLLRTTALDPRQLQIGLRFRTNSGGNIR